MPKKIAPLTNAKVQQSKPRDKEYNLFDGNGLMLRVKPNGSRLWIFNYLRPFTKKRMNISFGIYPAVTLAAARTKRAAARELLAQSIDPKEHRDTHASEQRGQLTSTLTKVAQSWYALKANKVTPKTGQRIWASIENHLLSDLGKYPISKLTAPITIEVLQPIASNGGLELVRRLCQRLNEIMNHAVNVGLIDVNSLSGIKSAFDTPTSQHMPTLKPEQLPELMRALNSDDIKIVTKCLIEFQLHTMTRPVEAATARWDEINLGEKLWTIPADKMKMKREHSIPLTEQAIYLLERLKPISGHREYVFPANNSPQRHTSSETANLALKRMGFKNRLVSHGLRALASSTLNEQGFDPDIIERALSHVDKNEVRRAYNRAEYLERRRIMMIFWSEHIEEATHGRTINKQNVLTMTSK